MNWVLVVISVVSTTVGDLLSAKGMALGGEINDFRPRGIARLLRYVVTHRLVVIGMIGNAVAFFSFLALLSIADLTFAVPAMALSYILKTALAKWYLGEYITLRRWAGAVLVAIGVALIIF
jgi:drug/metabolite transporter (DMT)-like permease